VNIFPGGLNQNMVDIPKGKHVFAGGYSLNSQFAFLNNELKNSEGQAWTPDHSDQYIQLGRWKTTPTSIPLRFSTFKLWDVALSEDELKALSSLDYNC